MVPVAEATRQFADAAKPFDYFSMISHAKSVRGVRTQVKGVECVPAICEDAYMAQKQTTGEIMLALKKRAGDLSLEDIAKRGDYAGKSSVQEYFKPTYDAPLGGKVALRLAQALEGLGNPPITTGEITSLATIIPKTNGAAFQFEGQSADHTRDDLPVYGTALGAEMLVGGESIEQTTLNTGDIIEYRKRPAISNGVERLYGLYVQGSSMYPAHRDGELLFVQKDAPLRIGDDVVVYLRPQNGSDNGLRADCVLVKRLVRRSGQYVELEQYSPPLTFRIPMDDVLRIDRVLTNNDIA